MKKIVVDIKGGLGNQMFCYAFAYAVAKNANAELYIDTTMLDENKVNDRQFEIGNYKIEYKRKISYKYNQSMIFRKLGINRFRKKKAIGFHTSVYHEKEARIFDPGVFDIEKNTYFDGFWQNYRYFDRYKKEITECFQPQIPISEEIQKLACKMQMENSASMHIRRGDYLGLNWQLPMDYYDAAIRKIKSLVKDKDLSVYVFSDDINYVKEYFSERKINDVDFFYVEYDDPNKVIFDMYLMSRCKHNIIANSSYSWWGAYMNTNPMKKVICPIYDVWKENFYPEDWIKLRV